jgi:hypothetical protein
MAGEFNMQLVRKVLLVFLMALSPIYAHAYVGPGLGAGTIGMVLGVIGSIFIALFAFLWYPLKRLLRKVKRAKQEETTR